MKTAVVIGAGKGMGNAIARRFAREGFKAVLVARRKEALESTVAELAKDGLAASYETADASDSNSLAEAIGRIGTPDVLVYNAAFMAGGKASELTPDEMVAHFKTDVVGAQVAAKCVIPGMRERGSGAIIFTGGLFGVHPNAYTDFACMSMDKSALRALALMLNSELKDTGVFAGIVNIMGVVGFDERLAPDKIADAYWELYSKRFDFEICYPQQ
ncbi:MAG: SDR family NAD(P)-dependent oxidoreductase [Kiritimatiellae bacterium]|nr:SDR family NAD(P)-dependent oxidoreductase [Kiritimatiellia bacterium]